MRRSQLSSRTIVTLALTALIMASNQPPALAAISPTAASTTAVTGSVRFSGEALFRGLAFAQGPVATLFAELATSADSLRPLEAVVAMDRVVGRIGALDGTFFDRFAAAIQSGNRVRIRAALPEAERLLGEAIGAEFGSQVSSAAGGVGADCIFFFAAIAVAVNLAAVAIVLVAAVATVDVAVHDAAVVAVTGFFTISSATQQQASALTRDRWVDKIARTLRV